MLQTLLDNFLHNLFKPLLLFFYAGFAIPLLRIGFDFPQALYQGLTIYLLLAIGWHGGEELASLPPSMIGQAAGFMVVGFFTNLIIGFASYLALRSMTSLRRVDAAAVAGYYGSDSAGTFVTCLGVLTAGHVAFAPYMPVMLAVMEIPGCLVALILVSRMRRQGMDASGNMPDEPGFADLTVAGKMTQTVRKMFRPLGSKTTVAATMRQPAMAVSGNGHSAGHSYGDHGHDDVLDTPHADAAASVDLEDGETTAADVALAEKGHDAPAPAPRTHASFGKLLHEVFLNPGTFLLFAGLLIGFVGRMQGEEVVDKYNKVFSTLFQGMLCLFLLEMGMTASKRLKDLRTAGWKFAAFALIAPNVFATLGIVVAHGYSMMLGQSFAVGTYVLFAVLCGSASYIAMPALQRMAIPEASPTLPLAASLGLTFSYNVTIGIPVYLMIATAVTANFPVGA